MLLFFRMTLTFDEYLLYNRKLYVIFIKVRLSMKNLRQEWLGNTKGDILAGIVVFMALIPEVMGFMIVAGVDPMVGVYATFCMTMITAIFGGRPGLISAAAGAMALVLANLVRDYGIEYMFAATILTGILQVIFGYLKIGNLLKFIPKPVMHGFVNSLGIMMFISQLEHFQGNPILLLLGAIGIAIIYLFPKVTKKIPSPIVAITVVTTIVLAFKIDIKTLGDMGRLTSELPQFMIPNVPFNLETLSIIFPYAISLSIVGIVESLLTAQLIDEITETSSHKNKETVAQGLANVVSGFFGGIAGCGMIGQSMVNLNYGGRGRLASAVAGSLMLGSMILFSRFVIKVPVVSLAAVMVVVSLTTINWQSFKRMHKVPLTDNVVMLTTVGIVVMTHNLAYGVVAGTLLSAIFLGIKSSKVQVIKVDHTYMVSGQLSFASASDFIAAFDYQDEDKTITIDFTNARLWDESAVDAIDKVMLRLDKNGIEATLSGLSPRCKALVDKCALHNKTDELKTVSGH